jgi:hypothetical protein
VKSHRGAAVLDFISLDFTAEAPKPVLTGASSYSNSVFLPKHRNRCFLRAAKRPANVRYKSGKERDIFVFFGKFFEFACSAAPASRSRREKNEQ